MTFSPLSVLADQKAPVTHDQKQEKLDYETIVEDTIDQVSNFMLANGIGSEWQAIGLAKSGKKVPGEYFTHFNQKIDSEITGNLDSGRIKITDIERLAIAATAIGKNPLDVNGYNLIELIYNSLDNVNGIDTMTLQGINGPIFGLIALDTDSFDIPNDARWTKEKLIQFLLDAQNDDGSWSLFGTAPSYDITAMALIALGKYKDDSHVQEAIQGAARFLSASQNEDAGFNDPWVGGVSVETASQVVIGLTSAGIDPIGPDFTKENGNLIDHILSFIAEDGGFKHLPNDATSNGMATEQGFQALVAYQLFINDEGRLYDFSKEDIIPDPEPETPDETIVPIISVKGLIDGKIYQTDKLTFTVEITDQMDPEILPVVQFNGQDLLPNDQQEYTVRLKAGENNIAITVTDRAGNQVTDSFIITYEPVEISESETEDDQENTDEENTVIKEDTKDLDTDKSHSKNMKHNVATFSADQQGEKLPNTSTNMFNYLWLGLMLMVAGSGIYLLRKKHYIHE